MKNNIINKLLRRLLTYFLILFPQKHHKLTLKNLIIFKIFSLEKVIYSTYFNTHDSLNNLCVKYNSKKHNYLDFLEFYFHSKVLRNSVTNILEVGIGTNYLEVPSTMGEDGTPGASLRMWRDFFPNSNIYGVDIDDRILFQEDRINTYKVDQNNEKEIYEFIKNYNLQKETFQLIIDDGHHIFPHNLTFFENTIDLLSNDGIYIIEDVNDSTYYNFMKYFESKDQLYFVMTNSFLNSKSKIGARMIMIQKKY